MHRHSSSGSTVLAMTQVACPGEAAQGVPWRPARPFPYSRLPFPQKSSRLVAAVAGKSRHVAGKSRHVAGKSRHVAG